MAGNSIRVNTDQVAQIATNIENLNKRLTEELTNSKAIIDNLSKIFQGEAAEATISNYDEFAAKYFQKYEDVITQYVNFLRVNVESGYFDAIAHVDMHRRIFERKDIKCLLQIF